MCTHRVSRRAQSALQGISQHSSLGLSSLRTWTTAVIQHITTGEEKMIKTIILSVCLATFSLSLNARAQDERQYTDGPVTEVDYLHVEYGHFEEYIDWLNSTWKPAMEAMKKAGLIINYKVFSATPKSPDQPNIYLWITYKNAAAALDKGVELEAVAKKVICSTECQNKARVARSEYRKVLGTEYIRELILK
jgi:L-rhamnose mutarotase